MKRHLIRRSLRILILLGLLAGCAPGQKYLQNGNDLAAQGDLPGGIDQVEKAVAAEPGNYAYRAQLVRMKASYVNNLLERADQLRISGHPSDAADLYRRVQGVDSANSRARDGLAKIEVDERHAAQVDSARVALGSNRIPLARAILQSVLAEDPSNGGALELRRRIDVMYPRSEIPAGLRDGMSKLVTLEFRDAGIKSVFEALARSSGVNFVFDREVKPDLKVTVFLQKTSVEDAVNVLTVTNQLDKKYLNDNTVLIYPNTAPKQKDYQELSVRTFYLSNADAGKIQTMLKTVLKTRDIYADEKLNSITVRDTPSALRLVEQMIAAQDLAEPEVTLEVEVLEVERSRLVQLGFDTPANFTLLNIVPSPTQTVAANGTVVTNTNPVTTTSQLTAANLKHVNAGSLGIPNPKVDIHEELGNTNLLANPRIRVKNREKAHILIGDKVPVITTTQTANVGVSESVSYLDVGLKLDVEPSVHLNNEVGIKIGLEVSSIVKQITTQSGTLTYQIGTRSATTELRLQDGETQALAGLINDQERHSSEGVPGLLEVPLVNRLFGDGLDQTDRTEIVLLITPHVVRNINYSREVPLEYSAGTETSSGAQPLVLRSSSNVSVPPMGDTGAGARGRPRGDSEPAPAPPEPSPDTPAEPAPAPAAAPPASTENQAPAVTPDSGNTTPK